MSFRLDNFWPFGSFQCTQLGSDPALTKANGSFAINLIGVGKNLSQAVPIRAVDYFAQIKVSALVWFFFFFSSHCYVFHYYLYNIFSVLFD